MRLGRRKGAGQFRAGPLEVIRGGPRKQAQGWWREGGRHVPHGHMQERSTGRSTGPSAESAPHPGLVQWWLKAPSRTLKRLLVLYLACTSAHLWSLGQERGGGTCAHRFMTRRSQVTGWRADWQADIAATVQTRAVAACRCGQVCIPRDVPRQVGRYQVRPVCMCGQVSMYSMYAVYP